MMPTTSPYEGIVEFKEAASVDEANGSLKSGYVLIKVIEKTNTDSSTTIVYVLGKPKAAPITPKQQPPTTLRQGPPPATSPPTTRTPSAEQRALESLNWKKFKTGNGEWAFHAGPTGESLPELKPAAAVIEKMKSDEKVKFILGQYVYNIKEKFLNRFPAK